MSSLMVKVIRIDQVVPHPNADRMELAHIGGWQCCTGKGQFRTGDLAIYIPPDAVLPKEFAEQIGVAQYLGNGNRVKTVRLRKEVSQGILIPSNGHREGEDVAEVYGITKWEPPVSPFSGGMQRKFSKKHTPYFPRYTDIENFNYFNTALGDDEEVTITEKLHGTNFRYGIVKGENPYPWYRFLYHRIRDGFGMSCDRLVLEGVEKYVGSHNVVLQEQAGNLYWQAANEQFKFLGSAIPHHLVFFGEIVGPSIQKGYDYGYSGNGFGVYLFDIYDSRTQEYLGVSEFLQTCHGLNLPTVPVLFRGSWGKAKQCLADFRDGKTHTPGAKHIREGCVIRPDVERQAPGLGRVILKAISPDYLIKQDKEGGTDFH